MLTLEQKAWQLHENAVSFASLMMMCQNEMCESIDEAVEIKWQQMFGKHN